MSAQLKCIYNFFYIQIKILLKKGTHNIQAYSGRENTKHLAHNQSIYEYGAWIHIMCLNFVQSWIDFAHTEEKLETWWDIIGWYSLRGSKSNVRKQIQLNSKCFWWITNAFEMNAWIWISIVREQSKRFGSEKSLSQFPLSWVAILIAFHAING